MVAPGGDRQAAGRWLAFLRDRADYYERIERWTMQIASAMVLGALGLAGASALLVDRVDRLNAFLADPPNLLKPGSLVLGAVVVALVLAAVAIAVANSGSLAKSVMRAPWRRRQLVALQASLLAAEADPDGGDRLSEWLREIEERWTAIEGLTEGEHGSGTEGET